MTTLTEFLLRQIEADEEAARAAAPGPWWNQEASRVYSKGQPWTESPWQRNALAVCENFDLPTNRANGAHIARHDPARVLAQCKALRRVVELHEPYDETCSVCALQDGSKYGDGWAAEVWPCLTLRALASIWAGAPGWDEGWA